ncbi:hypothetical protein [Proteus mirabilis]|uniref:hypothetical protein n=1 Tax=Proteus mirabilis TaxID=584 RepID=UPI0034D607BE
MSDTKVIDLDAMIYTELPLMGVESVDSVDKNKKILNYEIILLALEHIHTNNRPQFDFVMRGMKKMCNIYIDGFSEINENVNNLTKDINEILYPEPPLTLPMGMTFMAKGTGLNSLDSSVDKISNGCDGVLNGCTGLANQFSPIADSGDMTSFLKGMADFLVCPELSFINDIINGVNNIVDAIKNFRPDQILQELAGKLAEFVEEIVSDIASSIIDMAGNIADYYFSEGTMLNDLLDTIDMVLDMYDATWDMLMNTPIIGDMFRDLYNKKPNQSNGGLINQVIDNGLGSLTGSKNKPDIKYPEWDTPINNFPQPVETIRCKQLAKIAQQMEDSFRSNNRFDMYLIDTRMVSEITDPKVKDQISDYIRYGDRLNASINNKENARKLGFRGKTAYNSSMSNLMYITSTVRNNKAELSKVNNNDGLHNILVKMHNDNKYIVLTLNEEINKHSTLLEGLNNIDRQNKYYDFEDFGI